MSGPTRLSNLILISMYWNWFLDSRDTLHFKMPIKYASRLVASKCFPNVSCGNFRSTCWKQHVESNMLPAATFGQHLGNMLKATCCWQHVASGNFEQLLGNMLLSTCYLQHVAQMLIVCSRLTATTSVNRLWFYWKHDRRAFSVEEQFSTMKIKNVLLDTTAYVSESLSTNGVKVCTTSSTNCGQMQQCADEGRILSSG